MMIKLRRRKPKPDGEVYRSVGVGIECFTANTPMVRKASPSGLAVLSGFSTEQDQINSRMTLPFVTRK